MARQKATPRSGNYNGVNKLVLWSSTEQILPGEWTPAKCRAIEIGVGGGFVLMALLAVIA